MESFSYGQESQYHALHIRKARIDYSHRAIRKNRIIRQQLTKDFDAAILTYQTSFAYFEEHLTRLKQSTESFSPQLIKRVAERLEELRQFLSNIINLKRESGKEYKVMKADHLAAIQLWEKEVGILLASLSAHGLKTLGWAWAKEEPAEYEEGDEEFVPVEVVETCWDEFNVLREEMFI